jgi:hypothetical protein
MTGIDVVSILKMGLPGLVFLFALLSYSLLSKEQGKADPSDKVLRSIRFYIYTSFALAILTLASPIIDSVFFERTKVFTVDALSSSTVSASVAGEAVAVCHNANYANRYLLLKDVASKKMIQVFASSIVPCGVGEAHVFLSKEAETLLGWTSDRTSSPVEIATAPPGFKFIML